MGGIGVGVRRVRCSEVEMEVDVEVEPSADVATPEKSHTHTSRLACAECVFLCLSHALVVSRVVSTQHKCTTV